MINFPKDPNNLDEYVENDVTWQFYNSIWNRIKTSYLSTSTENSSFTIDKINSTDHYYYINNSAVVIEIPKSLPIGYRFTINVRSDTTMTTTGLIIKIPAGKSFAPSGDNSVINCIVISLDTIAIDGDLA